VLLFLPPVPPGLLRPFALLPAPAGAAPGGSVLTWSPAGHPVSGGLGLPPVGLRCHTLHCVAHHCISRCNSACQRVSLRRLRAAASRCFATHGQGQACAGSPPVARGCLPLRVGAARPGALAHTRPAAIDQSSTWSAHLNVRSVIFQWRSFTPSGSAGHAAGLGPSCFALSSGWRLTSIAAGRRHSFNHRRPSLIAPKGKQR
jgi:hypothetical protein